MRTNHAFCRRTLFCLGLGLALLGHFPLAHAIKKADMGKFGFNSSGNSKTIGPVQPGSSWQSTGNVGSIPAGHVGSQIGQTGWYVGTGGSANAANGSGPTMQLGHSGDVFFSGTKYPFQAGYQVPVSSIFEAASGLARGPLGIAALLAGPYLYDWINSANPDRVRVNSARDGVEINRDSIDRYCRLTPTESSDMSAWLAQMTFTDPGGGSGVNTTITPTVRGDQCVWVYKSVQWGAFPSTRTGDYLIKSKETFTGSDWLPASMDDIAPYMNTRPSPNIVPEILDKGGDIAIPAINPVTGRPQPTITGPSEVPGPSSTTTTPSGGTTTTRTSYRFTTNDNRVTTTTVINTCTGQGACTDTGDETVITPSPEPADDCEKNPSSIACGELDTPDGEIPRTTKELTYTEDTMFSGGGSCPADSYVTLHTGQTLKVWDWQKSCDMIVTYIRPLLLVVAAYIAFMMLVPQS